MHILCRHSELCIAARQDINTVVCAADELEPEQPSKCFDTVWICHTSARVQITTALIVALGMAWFALWLFLIYYGKHHLYGLPYTDFKVANLFLRLQVRTQLAD